MRKIFILGGSSLQLDLILEAKKMFFYTIVLDYDKNCVGSRWCDEFLHVDIANKEMVLQKAKEYEIDVILTSATELGNITACYVGEKLGLNTNSYQTALNTTNKVLMKQVMTKHNIKTAKYKVIDDDFSWDIFPCIVKPADSSAGRGLSYCKTKQELKKAISKAKQYSNNQKILIEEYIQGLQYSIETISSNKKHQIITINREFIHEPPHIIETAHQIPADINLDLKKNIKQTVLNVLNAFEIFYGASHIELKVDSNGNIYIIELASRTGGMRSEMINLAYGISYSQLLLFSAIGIYTPISQKAINKVVCNFLIDYQSYLTYLKIIQDKNYILFEPKKIQKIESNFKAQHIGESKGYYFAIELKK